MEPHSLVLLSAPALDHSHLGPHRRAQPLPLRSGPGRPFRDLAQGLARLIPQLRQFRERLWRTGTNGTSGVVQARWSPTTDAEPHGTSASGRQCSITAAHVDVQYARPLRQHVVPHHIPRPRHQQNEHERKDEEGTMHQRQRNGDQEDEQLPLQAIAAPHLQLQQRRGWLVLRRLRRAMRPLAHLLQPQGPGENDKTIPERILNVVTCGMFFHAGRRIVRLCHSTAARRFGWAFLAVGAIATVYHGSWGRLRPVARKIDYYSIALSSMMLRSAVLGPVPRWLSVSMLLAVPFKPTLVTTSSFTAVEVRYMLLALAHPRLLPAWAAHTGMSVAATACFTLDEIPPLSWFPFTHAVFHALSAAAFLTLPAALNQIAGLQPVALPV